MPSPKVVTQPAFEIDIRLVVLCRNLSVHVILQFFTMSCIYLRIKKRKEFAYEYDNHA